MYSLDFHSDRINLCQNVQIFSNQIHHHKINYYQISSNKNIIQFAGINETLAELEHVIKQLSLIEQKIYQINALLSNENAENKQRINYFLIDEQHNHYIDKIEVR